MDDHSTMMTDEDYVRAFRINLKNNDWSIVPSFKVNSQKEGEAIIAALEEREVLLQRFKDLRDALEKLKLESDGHCGCACPEDILMRFFSEG